jgi:hypothetical protein
LACDKIQYMIEAEVFTDEHYCKVKIADETGVWGRG